MLWEVQHVVLTSTISLISLCISSLSSFTTAVPIGLSLRRKPLAGDTKQELEVTSSGNLHFHWCRLQARLMLLLSYVRQHSLNYNSTISTLFPFVLLILFHRWTELNLLGIRIRDTFSSSSSRVCHSPFVQQLQFEASWRHHPPEAAVATVDRQSEALIIFWWKERAKCRPTFC